MEDMKEKMYNKKSLPRFLLSKDGRFNESKMLLIPDGFFQKLGESLPATVIHQFPNGSAIHLYHVKAVKSITKLAPQYKELDGEAVKFLILSYRGKGIFTVEIIGENLTEIKYQPSRRIPRCPVVIQDMALGKRWKIMVSDTGSILSSGSLSIPESFVQRFGSFIPPTISLKTVSNEEIVCTFQREEGKIHGMMTFWQRKIIQKMDILMFSYRKIGHFDLAIFDESKTEKTLKYEVIEVASDSEIAVGVEESLCDNPSEELPDAGNESEDINDQIGLDFVKVLSWSHINGSTHGVHIPARVKPGARDWISGEKVTLRNLEGDWIVGIVVHDKRARLSSGWNKFCTDNKLVEKQTLSFLLIQEVEGLIFHVE